MTRLFYILGQGHSLIDFAPFVAGVAAWMGSRDGRRGLTDLVTTSARLALRRPVRHLGRDRDLGGGRLPGLHGRDALGSCPGPSSGAAPPYWPVAVGAVGVAAFSAAGFAAGAFFPTRFTAPVAAFGGLLACGTSSQIGFQACGGWALILPTNSNNNFGQDAGIFYQFLPDLPIARVMFLAGMAVALVALLGAAGRPRAGHGCGAPPRWSPRPGRRSPSPRSPWPSPPRSTAYGMVIPALHDAASDRPIPYTPVCGQRRDPGLRAARLPALAARRDAALRPVVSQITGLPGAPGPGRAGRHRVRCAGPGPGRRRAAWARSRRSAASRRCSTCRWAR